jgi:hypothetical protein
MKICALFVLWFLLAPLGSYAQQTGISPVDQNPPVTRQEFEKRLHRVQKEIKKIDQGTKNTSQQLQETQQQGNQLQTNVQKIEVNQAVQSNDLTTFKDTTERNFHRITMTMIIVLAGVGLVFSGALWYVLRARKSRNTLSVVNDTNQAIPINPDVPTLQKIHLETGKLRIPFLKRLQSDSEKGRFEEGDFRCTAIFKSVDDPNEKPMVLFDCEKDQDPMKFGTVHHHAVLLAQKARVGNVVH